MLFVVLLILLLVGAFPAYSYGGNFGGISVGTLILILLIVWLAQGRSW